MILDAKSALVSVVSSWYSLGWLDGIPLPLPPPCNIVSVSITDLMELVQLYLLKYIISHLPPSLQPLNTASPGQPCLNSPMRWRDYNWKISWLPDCLSRQETNARTVERKVTRPSQWWRSLRTIQITRVRSEDRPCRLFSFHHCQN